MYRKKSVLNEILFFHIFLKILYLPSLHQATILDRSSTELVPPYDQLGSVGST